MIEVNDIEVSFEDTFNSASGSIKATELIDKAKHILAMLNNEAIDDEKYIIKDLESLIGVLECAEFFVDPDSLLSYDECNKLDELIKKEFKESENEKMDNNMEIVKAYLDNRLQALDLYKMVRADLKDINNYGGRGNHEDLSDLLIKYSDILNVIRTLTNWNCDNESKVIDKLFSYIHGSEIQHNQAREFFKLDEIDDEKSIKQLESKILIYGMCYAESEIKNNLYEYDEPFTEKEIEYMIKQDDDYFYKLAKKTVDDISLELSNREIVAIKEALKEYSPYALIVDWQTKDIGDYSYDFIMLDYIDNNTSYGKIKENELFYMKLYIAIYELNMKMK